MTKLESFLRGEYWLHFVTMFFCMHLLTLAGFPVIIYYAIAVAVPIVWELTWKIKRQTPVNLLDILFSIAGGVLAILI